MPKRIKKKQGERYALERSPLAQNPTQRDVAEMVKETISDLKTLATPHYKEQFLVRRTIETKGKSRNLVYPEGRLRAVHERLKFQLSKITQPSYLMSPRKGRAQRDNAEVHLEARQYLTLDLKQFYPSTTRQMIRNSLVAQFAMKADVAGLIAHIATADDRACFGSPLTPVLASIVHRPMFDQIADLCDENGLSYSVWVDDLTISGPQITGQFKASVRSIVASNGLQSHKLRTPTGKRPVFITGIGVVGANLIVPKRIELRSKELWADFKESASFEEKDASATRLLSHLGGIRAVVGASSKRGQKLASEMNSIRQKREKARRAYETSKTKKASVSYPIRHDGSAHPQTENSQIPF